MTTLVAFSAVSDRSVTVIAGTLNAKAGGDSDVLCRLAVLRERVKLKT